MPQNAKIIRSIVLFLALALPVTAQTIPRPIAELPEGVGEVVFPAAAMIMVTSTGEYPMLIEFALTAEQRQRGLMYRPDLPDNYGMLFVFPDSQPLSFWMKNTLSPLDIIYIRPGGMIDSIQQGTPRSEETLPSDGPAKFVLELRAGLAETYGLRPGTVITFK